jgi:multidrug resistance efflux pump
MANNTPSSEQDRSEEVQHIIEKMPTRFGLWLGVLIFVIFLLLISFGYLIKYPDIAQGNINISRGISPVKLVSNSSGKIHLIIKKSDLVVTEGQLLGYIENSAKLDDIKLIERLLSSYNFEQEGAMKLFTKLPTHLSLGELNSKYYQLSSSLQNYLNYKKDLLYAKQEESLRRLYKDQTNSISSASIRVENAISNLEYSHKFYLRDSTLFRKKVISESELDKSEVSYIGAKDALQQAQSLFIAARQSAEQTHSKINDLTIQIPEKEKELTLSLISSLTDLLANIKSWEQRYLFKAPFMGKIQFLRFYEENQFIQSGEEVFSIIPNIATTKGQLFLPSKGAGKVKIGQEVIVKLEDYPYLEYGSIRGIVNSISLTSTAVKTDNSLTSAYLINVTFPVGIVTNYGSTLELKADSKGTAEIITNDRKLIERLFDNMRYQLIKK